MAFKAFAFNLNKEEENTIRRMVAVATDEKVQLVDTMSFKPECNKEDIIFLYGKRVHRQFKNSPCRYKLEFPDIPALVDKQGDPETRKHAFQVLVDLKEKLASGELESVQETVNRVVLTEESLPAINADDVLVLQKYIQEQNQDYWQGTTKKGQSVRLTVAPTSSDADVNMTFAELYAVKMAIETLNLKEVEVVPRTKPSK